MDKAEGNCGETVRRPLGRLVQYLAELIAEELLQELEVDTGRETTEN